MKILAYFFALCWIFGTCSLFAQTSIDSIPSYQFLPRKVHLLESYKNKVQNELFLKVREQVETSSVNPVIGMEYQSLSSVGNNIITSETKAVPHTQDIIPYSSISNGPVSESWKAIYTTGFDSVEDKAISITCDNKGYVYVTGSSESENDIDFLTTKYDTSGIEQWTGRYDGPGNSVDQSVKVVVDKNDNIYVAGSSEGLNSIYTLYFSDFSNQ